MGSKGFVCAEQIKISSQVIYVRQAMRGYTNPVGDRHHNDIVNDGIDGVDIIDGADDVGTKGKTHQARTAADQVF